MWQSYHSRGSTHGIDDGSAYLGWYREGLAIIVWTDVMECDCPIEADWDKTNKRARFKGYVKSVSSPKIDVECYVSKRMMGSMTIGQQEYDLANGSLFLISFRTPGTKVAQINYDTYALTELGKKRKQMVEDIPEIRAFFEGTANE